MSPTGPAVINATTGVITGFSGASSVAVGNGWYRVFLPVTVTVASGNGTYWVISGPASSVFIWGAQLEAGAFPTSYIPTVASTVTRSADVASMPTSAFPYNFGSGTLISVTRLIGLTTTAAQRDLTLAASNQNNSIYMLANNTAGSRDAVVISGGSGQGFNNVAGATTASDTKQGFAFATNDTAHVVNGAAPITDSTVTLPVSAAITLHIGTDVFNSNQLNGYIIQIAYYPIRVTNTQLQALTT
jgi:hypothetical protein